MDGEHNKPCDAFRYVIFNSRWCIVGWGGWSFDQQGVFCRLLCLIIIVTGFRTIACIIHKRFSASVYVGTFHHTTETWTIQAKGLSDRHESACNPCDSPVLLPYRLQIRQIKFVATHEHEKQTINGSQWRERIPLMMFLSNWWKYEYLVNKVRRDFWLSDFPCSPQLSSLGWKLPQYVLVICVSVIAIGHSYSRHFAQRHYSESLTYLTNGSCC